MAIWSKEPLLGANIKRDPFQSVLRQVWWHFSEPTARAPVRKKEALGLYYRIDIILMALAHRLHHVLSKGSRSQLTHIAKQNYCPLLHETLCFVPSPTQQTWRTEVKAPGQTTLWSPKLSIPCSCRTEMVRTVLCCIYKVNFGGMCSSSVVNVIGGMRKK